MNKFSLTVAGLLTVAFITACSNGESAEDDSKTITKVNQTNITEEEFVGELKDRFGEQVLNDLVSGIIIDDKAKELNIDSEEMDKELQSFKENYGVEDDEQLLSMMEMQFQLPIDSIEAFKEEVIKPQLVIQKLATQDVEITEEEKKQYFEENKESLETVTARHILVEDKETANKLTKQLEDGEDFAALAEEYSKDPGSAAEGGELPPFKRGQMVEPFEEKAFSLEPGKVSDPVKSQNGYHIIEVIEKKSSYEELEGEVEALLTQEQSKSPQEVLAELKEEAKIKVQEPSYEDWVQQPSS